MEAIGKKRRRTPGAKAPAKRRKRRVAGPAAVAGTKRTFGGQAFTKVQCSLTKTDAQKKAVTRRAAGGKARVVKNPAGKGYCVYARSR